MKRIVIFSLTLMSLSLHSMQKDENVPSLDFSSLTHEEIHNLVRERGGDLRTLTPRSIASLMHRRDDLGICPHSQDLINSALLVHWNMPTLDFSFKNIDELNAVSEDEVIALTPRSQMSLIKRCLDLGITRATSHPIAEILNRVTATQHDHGCPYANNPEDKTEDESSSNRDCKIQ